MPRYSKESKCCIEEVKNEDSEVHIFCSEED